MFSYLDAGTGSAIVMALAGGLAGVVVLMRMYWNRILGVVSPKHRARAKEMAASLSGETDPDD